MSTQNDITGDPLQVKAMLRVYIEHWEAIYGIKPNQNKSTFQPPERQGTQNK